MSNLEKVMENFPMANQNHDLITKVSTLTSANEIESGLCKNCDYNKDCVWKHNNKLFCEQLN